MLMYNISGSDYDSIGVVEYNSIHSIKSMQYYFKDSKILRASNVKFNTKVRGLEICLASIESDDTDTVIKESGEKSHVTLEELNRTLGFTLDEAFFSDIFGNHIIDTDKGKLMVYKEEI